jgi:hypothetical protein
MKILKIDILTNSAFEISIAQHERVILNISKKYYMKAIEH